MTVQLSGPDDETARIILSDRTERAGLNIDEEAIKAIVETVGKNGHKLIGAVETLRAHVLLQEVKIDDGLVRRVLTVDI